MSLFETLSDMSSGYADALDAGQYKFAELPAPEPEPAPTVSLYNLLDHSHEDLIFLWNCANKVEIELRPNKLAMADSYQKAVSWMNIIAGALRERQDRDSEAWATQTAKEINETH